MEAPMSGGAHEGPAPSVEFDLDHIEVNQVVCTHRPCRHGKTVATLYEAEKFRILHICPSSST
jgi:predicted metallopeptidase